MRLAYLDETGTSNRAVILSVAGIIIHGDKDWPEVDRRILALIDKYVPEPDRPGFVFHATDVYHGSGYFDRRKPEWDSDAKRWPILDDLAAIIRDLQLPVVAGSYKKDTFGIGILAPHETHRGRARVIQNVSVLDCLLWTDRWLARFAPDELATVIHEDGTDAKTVIKLAVRLLRSEHQLKLNNLEDAAREFGLPLKRIIDTVHFAEKADARPLQLADICAFILGRALQEKHAPSLAVEIVFSQLGWIKGTTVPAKIEEARAALGKKLLS